MPRFDFPKEKGLQTYSAIYVPSTTGVNKNISNRQFHKRVEEVQKFMTKEFGGVTIDKRNGIYHSKNGNIVRENIAIVENYSTFKDWERKDQTIQKFLKNKAKEWKQESIAVEFEAPHKPRRMVFVKAKLNKVL